MICVAEYRQRIVADFAILCGGYKKRFVIFFMISTFKSYLAFLRICPKSTSLEMSSFDGNK